MNFHTKRFDELTTRELYEILKARSEIFLLEQGIVCQDLDDVDYTSIHCFIEDDDKLVAYLRAYTDDEGTKIGRVLTMTHGVWFGRLLMEKSIPVVTRQFNTDRIILHAQTQAQGFYEKLGFSVISNEFLEEGVPHVTMEFKAGI